MAKKSSPKLQRLYADRIWSRIIRSRGQCERCGDITGPFEAAHIIRRRYSHTRTVLDNGWCLCRACHTTVDSTNTEFMGLVEKTIGYPMLYELEQLSNRRTKVNWWDEHARLKAHAKEVGV